MLDYYLVFKMFYFYFILLHRWRLFELVVLNLIPTTTGNLDFSSTVIITKLIYWLSLK